MILKRLLPILCFIGLTLIACQSKLSHDHIHAEGEAHSHADGEAHNHEHSDQKIEQDHIEGEIIFTKEQAKTVGLELETLKKDVFNQVIKTSGQILSAQGDEATISATTSGIVSFNKSSLNEGMQVKAGETLLSISSQNMVDGDPIIKAKNNFEVAKREFERAEKLIVDKLISEVEYNEIKLNYSNAKASYSQFAKGQTSKGAAISSPISGFIKSKLVSEGEYVNVGQPIATITQSRRLRLAADVSERYYKYLSTIKSANFKTPYDEEVYELADLNGKVVSYGRSVVDSEYTLPVNFEFNNVGNIIPGSYVDVYLLSDEKKNVLTVPISSLYEDQGTYFVFKQLDAEGYKKIEVQLGTSNGQRTEILKGVEEGDIVVSKATIHVNLAASASAMPHAHEH